MPEKQGARYIPELLTAYGVTAFFFVPSILSRTLAQMDDFPIRRIMAHGEKAAA